MWGLWSLIIVNSSKKICGELAGQGGVGAWREDPGGGVDFVPNERKFSNFPIFLGCLTGQMRPALNGEIRGSILPGVM